MISFFTGNGGAGVIRGRQIADKIGARLNPKDGYDNDICIYVKSFPTPFTPKYTYIDVVEDSAGLRWVKSHPKVSIIASSKSIYNHLKSILKNKIILIPQHHCNFERSIRTRKRITVAGIIGNKASFQYPLDKLEDKLKEIGIKLKTLIKKRFDNRQEVVNFYKTIDIQLIWRPKSDGILRNPLKLVNALSFGIPTVAYPEENFMAEFKGDYLPVGSISDMVYSVKNLKYSDQFYNQMAIAGRIKAEEYHIDNISKLYLKLC